MNESADRPVPAVARYFPATALLGSPGRVELPRADRVGRPPVSVFLPKEHGSWSLALEPLVLALLVAPSMAGGALAVVVLTGFFARRPLAAAFAPLGSERRRAARVALVVLSALAAAGVFELLVLGEWAALWPLLLVAPLGGLFAWCDAQGESRAASAEVAGSAAFALLPAAIATLAGWPAAPALGLAAFALVRSVPTVLTLRAFLRRRKGQQSSSTPALLAALAGLGVLMVLAAVQIVPWLVTGGAAVLLVRALWFARSSQITWTARQIGTAEAVLGLGYLALAAFAWLR